MKYQSLMFDDRSVEEIIRVFLNEDCCGICFSESLNDQFEELNFDIDMQDVLYVLNNFKKINRTSINNYFFVNGHALDGAYLQIHLVLSMEKQRVEIKHVRRLSYGK